MRIWARRSTRLIPDSCTKYCSEAQNALFLKRSWSDFDPQAYYLYGEDQNHETSFKDKALQAAVDSWCKIQVIIHLGCWIDSCLNNNRLCLPRVLLFIPCLFS